jgi:capsular polysaccharide biosynthesis protein
MTPGLVDLRTNVEAGRGRVTDLSEPAHSAFRAPDFLVGAVNAEFLRTYAAQSLVLGTALFHVKHASVTAEGVVFTDGRLNTCNELNTDLAYVEHYHAGTRERFDRLTAVTVTDPVVLLTGPGHLVYGHWLVDFLPKLYLLSLAGYRFSRLRFLIPADTPAFALAWLDLLGIGPGQLLRYDRLANVVVCRELIVPTALRFGSRASPLFRQAAAFLTRHVENRLFRRRSRNRRLFVSRSSNAVTLNNRTLLQREAFEAQARARGFEIVRPEILSIPDQVRLFASADMLCGEYGSGLHGSMFCRPGATIMAARDDGIALGFLQSGIDQTLGHANGYVIGAGTPQGDGGFSVDEADLALAFDWLHWRHHA